VTVKVWNSTLPEPKNSTFSYTNWFSSANMNGDGFPSFMDAYYDAASFNDNFFTVMGNWAKVMAKQRQNVIYVPTMALLASDMTMDANGNYKFTFKNFDRYVETFLKNGSVKALEGGFFYEKEKRITRIKELYRQYRFSDCIKECMKLSERDDEINLILADCYYNIGKHYVLYGALNKGATALNNSLKYSSETVYDTTAINNATRIYISLCKNVKSPLLEFDREGFERTLAEKLEYELYKYVTKDNTYNYKNESLRNHVLAKERIAKRDYRGALDILLKIEANKKSYNAHVFFNVYTDIEMCYKQLLDFENAYRYANKRISLMEGFKN
jgi:hypothetical protein